MTEKKKKKSASTDKICELSHPKTNKNYPKTLITAGEHLCSNFKMKNSSNYEKLSRSCNFVKCTFTQIILFQRWYIFFISIYSKLKKRLAGAKKNNWT